MIGEKSSEFACGQILYTLKMYKLNYLVKETAYSVHLTIRKKFVREGTDSQIVTIDSNSNSEIEAENHTLKEKNANLTVKARGPKNSFFQDRGFLSTYLSNKVCVFYFENGTSGVLFLV